MVKKLLGYVAITVVLVINGTGCRHYCDTYCDKRDRERDYESRSRRDGCNDPCRTPPPAYNDCR